LEVNVQLNENRSKIAISMFQFFVLTFNFSSKIKKLKTLEDIIYVKINE